MAKDQLPTTRQEPKDSPFLPVKAAGQALADYVVPRVRQARKSGIPNASLIYGAGAAGLMAFSLWHFFAGNGVYAFLLIVLAVLLFGFALFFMKQV